MDEFTVHHYLTSQGQDVFNLWLQGLRDLKHRYPSSNASTAGHKETWGTTNLAGMAYGNCALAMGTGFIAHNLV